jgi:metal-sulfur cluster biosynthetic enzyme
MKDDLVAQVRNALREVIDPELGYNIVDLGFIYDIVIVDGAARITMTATTRGCPAAGFLKEGASQSVSRVAGIQSVDVLMTFEPAWTPSMIEPATKALLGFRNTA